MKILGIEWDILKDDFILNLKILLKMQEYSKLLKEIIILKMVAASFFDPLGFITSITSRVKTIFQLTCRDKNGWDEIVAGGIELAWTELLKDHELLSFIRAPKLC